MEVGLRAAEGRTLYEELDSYRLCRATRTPPPKGARVARRLGTKDAYMARFRYPLSFQTVLPIDYAKNEEFRRLLALMKELGLWGIELNVADPGDARVSDVAAVRAFLARFGLNLSMYATGLTAKSRGLSLSDTDEERRRAAAEGAKGMIRWVAGSGAQAATSRSAGDPPKAGIIIGFLKGGVSSEPSRARAQLVRSLVEIAPHAREAGVPVLLEATNRYEASVANSLADTVAVIRDAEQALGWHERPATLQILPDTFHMNIEEPNMERAMKEHASYFSSFHLSDNNRRFPGFGAIDFAKVASILGEMGYQGRVAIEGNTGGALLDDLRRSVEYLAAILAS